MSTKLDPQLPHFVFDRATATFINFVESFPLPLRYEIGNDGSITVKSRDSRVVSRNELKDNNREEMQLLVAFINDRESVE